MHRAPCAPTRTQSATRHVICTLLQVPLSFVAHLTDIWFLQQPLGRPATKKAPNAAQCPFFRSASRRCYSQGRRAGLRRSGLRLGRNRRCTRGRVGQRRRVRLGSAKALAAALGAAPRLKRAVLLSRMGVTRAARGPFGLPGAGFDLLEGETRLRAAAAERSVYSTSKLLNYTTTLLRYYHSRHVQTMFKPRSQPVHTLPRGRNAAARGGR